MSSRNDAIFACCMAVAMLLLFLVAVMVPKNVITQYRVLQDYVAATGAVIPGIDRLAAVSSFPEVTKLVVSLVWAFVPIFTAIYLWKVRIPDSFLARLKQRPFFLSFAGVVMAISIVLVAVLYDITPRDLEGGRISKSVLRTLSTSRIGLGLIAGFFSAGIAMMVYVVLIWLLSLPRVYFSKPGGARLRAWLNRFSVASRTNPSRFEN